MITKGAQISLEIVVVELRALGLTIRSEPGEYRVNFRHGSEATARMVETLDEALEIGHHMAAEAAAKRAETKRTLRRRKRWRKQMTPKVRRRRFILGHNRRLRRCTLRKQR